jgi:adenylate kinase
MAERHVPASKAGVPAGELVFIGPPGVGKGTQAKRLQQNFGWIQLSTGDLFRDNIKRGTELGKLAQSYTDKGEYVPDDVTVDMVKQKFDSLRADERVMLDGFPRTLAQAESLDRLLRERRRQVGKVLVLKVPRDELVRRILARSQAEGRPDDTPEVIGRRFDVYEAQTKPVIDYYASRDFGGKRLVTEIDGVGTIDDVTERLSRAARDW